MSKVSHNERLVRWKQKQSQENKAQFKADINRIVAMIDCNMYGVISSAKPLRPGGARISATTQSRGGE